MRIAVIGSDGQVGQEFRKCLPADQLIMLNRGDVDITDPASVQACVERLDRPVIVNLAAFHDVNGCEDDPTKAFAVNALGVANVAKVAARAGCKVVHFSSDYVFGLEKGRDKPYLESDATGPLNVYGVSKIAGEHLLRAFCSNHLIVRTSSLFGVVTSKKGWTFPEMILRRAKAGEPLKVVNDQFMAPTYTLDLVRTVVALIAADSTGTVHVTNAGGCSWHEFACAVLETAGVKHPIQPVDSKTFPAKAQRPSYSLLASERLGQLGVQVPRDWRESLRAYLIEKGEIKS